MKLKQILLLAIILPFIACDNEPLEGDFVTDFPSVGEGFFVAQVDGNNFEAIESSAVLHDAGFIHISGISSDFSSITLLIRATTEGSYTLPQDGNGGYTTLNGDIYLATELSSGQVVITEINLTENYVSGTFSFQGTNLDGDTISITNGEFNVPIIEEEFD